jgi:DNA-binding winged helix-turn-helix (wHTH) protein
LNIADVFPTAAITNGIVKLARFHTHRECLKLVWSFSEANDFICHNFSLSRSLTARLRRSGPLLAKKQIALNPGPLTSRALVAHTGQVVEYRASSISAGVINSRLKAGKDVDVMEKLGPHMRFGGFEADFRTQELRKQGVRVKLPRQSFQILQKLLERPGELVTRDELRQALWPGDTYVDFDHGVNNSVKRIRDALGDSPDAPRYIETLPRLGYRFVGSIDEAPVVPVPVVSSAAPEEVARPARWRWRFFLLGLALALVLAGIARRWFFPRVKESVPVVEIVPLTGVIGKQNLASFSPDGSQVTFTLTNDSKQGNGLYTALVGGDTFLQLTDDPGDCCSAWSPDGQAVAFSRNSENGFDIYTVSPLGGTPRKLYARSARKLYAYSLN